MPARRISPSSAQSSGLTLLIATEILIQARRGWDAESITALIKSGSTHRAAFALTRKNNLAQGDLGSGAAERIKPLFGAANPDPC